MNNSHLFVALAVFMSNRGISQALSFVILYLFSQKAKPGILLFASFFLQFSKLNVIKTQLKNFCDLGSSDIFAALDQIPCCTHDWAKLLLRSRSFAIIIIYLLPVMKTIPACLLFYYDYFVSNNFKSYKVIFFLSIVVSAENLQSVKHTNFILAKNTQDRTQNTM